MVATQDFTPYSRHTHFRDAQHQKLVDAKAEKSGTVRFERHSASGSGLKPIAKKSGNGTGNWGSLGEQIAEGCEAAYKHGSTKMEPESKLQLD